VIKFVRNKSVINDKILKFYFNDIIFVLYIKIIPPYGLRLLKKYSKKISFSGENKNFLDIGCGNSSPLRFAYMFDKNYNYYGLDREEYNIRTADKSIGKIYSIDLEKQNIKEILKNTKFSIINFTHVIEHLNNGYDVISQLREIQPKGGLLYIETPSPESITFKSTGSGTLNFFDDASHKKVYPIDEIEKILIKNNYKIIKKGKRKDYRMLIIFPIAIIIFILIRKPVYGTFLWDIKGFANYILAEAI